MPLPNSGQVSLDDIATEFGGDQPHQLSEYHGEGNSAASGEIQVSEFHGASAEYEIQALLVAGGGGGGGNRTGSNGRRIVPGTNAEINVFGYILDEPQEAAQAPIQPFKSPQPQGYIKRKSNTLLGNAKKGRKSNRYFRTPNSGSQPVNYIIY